MENQKELRREIRMCVREAEKWDNRYLDVTIRSLERYEDRRKFDRSVQKFLSRTSSADFKATNPYSKRTWIPAVLESMFATLAEERGLPINDPTEPMPGIACAMITFTHKQWACPDSNINFDIKSAKRLVRNALAGTSFIGCFEPGVYKNEDWEHEGKAGRLISFHCHAICWSTSRSVLTRLRRRIEPRFDPILNKRSGVRLDTLKTPGDIIKALMYAGKMPYLGYRTMRNKVGKTVQRCAMPSLRSRYCVFKFMKDHPLSRFWLSGGEGVKALRDARMVLSRRKPQEKPRQKPKYRYTS